MRQSAQLSLTISFGLCLAWIAWFLTNGKIIDRNILFLVPFSGLLISLGLRLSDVSSYSLRFPFLWSFLVFCAISTIISAEGFRAWVVSGLTLSTMTVFGIICLAPVTLPWVILGRFNCLILAIFSATVLLLLLVIGPDAHIGDRGVFRLNGYPFDHTNPNNLMNMLIPLTFIALIMARDKDMALGSIASILGFMTVGLCNSTAGIMGCMVGLVVTMILDPNKRWLTISCMCVLMAGFGGAQFWSNQSPPEISALQVRVGIWKEFLKIWLENPIFGKGMARELVVVTSDLYGNLKSYTTAHNVYIHLLAQGGIIGFFFASCAAAELFRLSVEHNSRGYGLGLYLLVTMSIIALAQKGPFLQLPSAGWAIIWVPAIVVIFTDASLRNREIKTQ